VFVGVLRCIDNGRDRRKMGMGDLGIGWMMKRYVERPVMDK
jgi:hypothetical protein